MIPPAITLTKAATYNDRLVNHLNIYQAHVYFFILKCLPGASSFFHPKNKNKLSTKIYLSPPEKGKAFIG